MQPIIIIILIIYSIKNGIFIKNKLLNFFNFAIIWAKFQINISINLIIKVYLSKIFKEIFCVIVLINFYLYILFKNEIKKIILIIIGFEIFL